MAARDWAVLHQNRISGRNTTGNAVPEDAFRVEPEVTFDAMAEGLDPNGMPPDSKGGATLPMDDQDIDDEGV